MNKELLALIEKSGNTVDSFIASLRSKIEGSGITLSEFTAPQQQKIICMYAAVELCDTAKEA